MAFSTSTKLIRAASVSLGLQESGRQIRHRCGKFAACSQLRPRAAPRRCTPRLGPRCSGPFRTWASSLWQITREAVPPPNLGLAEFGLATHRFWSVGATCASSRCRGAGLAIATTRSITGLPDRGAVSPARSGPGRRRLPRHPRAPHAGLSGATKCSATNTWRRHRKRRARVEHALARLKDCPPRSSPTRSLPLADSGGSGIPSTCGSPCDKNCGTALSFGLVPQSTEDHRSLMVVSDCAAGAAPGVGSLAAAAVAKTSSLYGLSGDCGSAQQAEMN